VLLLHHAGIKNSFFHCIYDAVTNSGFEATLQACKTLGLDLSTVPMGVLQIFYNSGMSFSDHPGAFTPEQRQKWRDSVIWPRQKEAREPDSSPPKLPPIIEKRRPGRPRKNPLPE
jgi:hypothetical protein